MLSAPGHPFMQKVIETVFSESCQKSVTGPLMLMDLYEKLPDKEKSEVYLIPDKYVTPFDVDQARSVVEGAETEDLEKCLAEAYAVHYFFGHLKNDRE